MDGRKPLLRNLFIASLALVSHAAASQADETARQPSRMQKPPVLPLSTDVARQGAPGPQLMFSGPLVINVPEPKPSLHAPVQSKDSGTDKAARRAPNPVFALRPSKSPTITEPLSQRRHAPVVVDEASRSVRDEGRITATAVESPPPRTASIKSSRTDVTVTPGPNKPEAVSAASKPQPPGEPATAASKSVLKLVTDKQVDKKAAPLLSDQPPVHAAIVKATPVRVVSKLPQTTLTMQGSATDYSQGSSPSAIEPGPGWQAVSEQLKNHLAKCEELISRKAYLSAIAESNQAIIHLVRVLDLRQNKLACEPAWTQSQQALREAQEFTSFEQIANDQQLFASLIQGHETPVLRDAVVTELTPLAAAQHYRAYAEQSLVNASLGHPWFSELYYCLGRSLQAQAEGGHPQAEALLQEALTYYRAANSIQPTNANSANQLCFVLLRMDRPAEAVTLLGNVVRLPDCPLEAWQNLAEASSRLGDQRTEQWAVQNYVALKSQGVRPSGPIGTLVEVDPKQFAAMSPRTSGPQALTPTGTMNSATSVTSSSAAVGAAPTSAPVTPNRTASTPRFGIFR